MSTDIAGDWKYSFFKIVEQPDVSSDLKEASLNENLADWTRALTTVCINTCSALGWRASAKGHQCSLLPVKRNEYLSLDVMAFADSNKKWRYPVAVFELENSFDNDQIAYSLWKLLCVRADLRIVFCYRKTAKDGSALVKYLQDDVITAMGISGRLRLNGESIIVVGSRDDAGTFPYKFFKWWSLDKNTGKFNLL